LIAAGFLPEDISVRSVLIDGGVLGVVAVARNGKRVRDVMRAD
jgi:hypothetical protein